MLQRGAAPSAKTGGSSYHLREAEAGWHAIRVDMERGALMQQKIELCVCVYFRHYVLKQDCMFGSARSFLCGCMCTLMLAVCTGMYGYCMRVVMTVHGV